MKMFPTPCAGEILTELTGSIYYARFLDACRAGGLGESWTAAMNLTLGEYVRRVSRITAEQLFGPDQQPSLDYFGLIGSRALGANGPDSDWDFIAPHGMFDMLRPDTAPLRGLSGLPWARAVRYGRVSVKFLPDHLAEITLHRYARARNEASPDEVRALRARYGKLLAYARLGVPVGADINEIAARAANNEGDQ